MAGGENISGENQKSQAGRDKHVQSAVDSQQSVVSSQQSSSTEEKPGTSNLEPETSNLPTGQAGIKPQTEEMEVHKHPHHVTHKKKWGEYLLEFLMIFLAVFLGFLAENAREKAVENHREEEYIHSMIEDVQTDIVNLSKQVEGFKQIELQLDTVLRSFDDGIHVYSESWTRNFILSHRGGFPDFYYTDRTIQQLKNAGGMRLIKNKMAANGIINYDAGIKDLVYEESFLVTRQQNYIDEVLKVWSVDQMLKDAGVTSWTNNREMPLTKNYWITSDHLAFEHLFNKISEYNEAIIRHRKAYSEMKTVATSLIDLLKKEYHVE